MALITRAAVVRGAGAPFELSEIDLPEPAAGQVRVRVAGTGMCQTDLHVRAGTLYQIPYPAVLGHECAGTVEAVGEGCGLKVCDSVVVTFAWCGVCPSCRHGRPNYCDEAMRLNYTQPRFFAPEVGASETSVNTGFFGQSSFADRVLCDERSAIRVDVAPDAGLELLGPFGCSVQTGAGTVLYAARLGSASTVAVFGAGAVGLSAVMAAKAVGARRIVVVDMNTNRLALSEEIGADAVVDAGNEDVVKSLKGIERSGFDAIIDCTGSPTVLPQAMRCIRATGSTFLVGVPPPGTKVEIDPGRLFGRSLTGVVQGDSYPPAGIPEIVELWRSGRLPVERIVTRFPLAEIEEAARAMKSGEVIKPILIP